MGVFETLSEMMERAFNESLLDGILLAYQEEMKNVDFKVCEDDYNRASECLPKSLTAEQLELVAEAERLYKEETRINLRIGFKRGLYAAFVLGDKADDFRGSFTTLVMQEITKKHTSGEFYDARENKVTANHILNDLDECLDPFSQEHLSSILAAWDERSYAALRYGFQLGYFAAQSIVLDIEPERYEAMKLVGWEMAYDLLLPFDL